MHPHSTSNSTETDITIGRIVSVTGAKAILLLDGKIDASGRKQLHRPEMGTLLAIDTHNTIVLAIVSALSVPVPAQREGDSEIWIAELGLVGELWKSADGKAQTFNRGVTIYPTLGDRVRIANKSELTIAFCGDTKKSVRVGCIRQDSSIPAMVRVDDLLGKHFAILGTTGTGKSCTTALILRAILEKNPAAHIVLLDPHNEYATAFPEWAEVISPRNMHLPFWLLTFEEIVEVLIGDGERKAEIEILQELIPIAKSRYSGGRTQQSGSVRRGVVDHGRYTVDTPVPYRISDLTGLIDERMGKLENKRDLSPFRVLKQRIDAISQDSRYGFMFGSLTVYDGMTQVLGRIFRVPVNQRPITILELTGIPTEIVNVVVSVLCRMTFDFALWSEGQVPVTIVCEEAHRYVPANPSAGFEPCKRSIAKIAKEGRKYGASLCIVTQRPAEIDPTILSQCNTVFALRMSNDRDQAIVQSAISDTGSGLLEFLSALGQREAIAFGDGVTLPVRIRFDELPKAAMPRSSSAKFTDRWQKSVGDEGFLEHIVERWRSSGASDDEQDQSIAMMADAVLGNETRRDQRDEDFGHMSPPSAPRHYEPRPVNDEHNGSFAAAARPAAPAVAPAPQRPVREPAPLRTATSDSYAPSARTVGETPALAPARNAAAAAPVRRELAPPSPPRPAGSMLRRDTPTPPPAAAGDGDQAGSQTLRSLRDRLMQRQR
ncbi:MAG: ATP-binding protein [Hyphomicrobiaceae bacterium]|nr:ATP-binding protein [Hyphomicrobiaceae bacterium]